MTNPPLRLKLRTQIAATHASATRVFGVLMIAVVLNACAGPDRGESVATSASSALTSSSWVAVAPLDAGRYMHAAALLQNQQVLVTGGFGSPTYLNTAELYDPLTRRWKPASALRESRMAHTSTTLADGNVLVVGGLGPERSLASVEVYDAANDTWSLTGSLSEPRTQHTATLLQNGKVLVVGGFGASSFHNLATAELYDPTTRTWATAGTLAKARYQNTATLLKDGKVLVVGGLFNEQAEFLDSCELYDPATNTWSKAAPLSQPRRDHAATLLTSGKVLVAAGDNAGGDLVTAELYDPQTNTWQATGPLSEGRSEPSAALLPDGGVLLIGGGRNSNPPRFLNTVERYTPESGTWIADAPMQHEHYAHTTTVFGNGQVLVTGGFDGGFSSNVDLYLPSQSGLGEECTAAVQCASGFCVDGVCCDSACAPGSCNACSVIRGARGDGFCTLFSGPPCNDGDACTSDDSCVAGSCVGHAVVHCAQPPHECGGGAKREHGGDHHRGK